MQFQIPQFIEVEDKIFGPLTFKQFLYVAGGVGGAYLLFRVLPIFISLPLIGLELGFALALAFVQFNGRPFEIALEHGFYYLLHPKLYLWNNQRKQHHAVAKTQVTNKQAETYIPKLSESRLHELSWSLDIKEKVAAGEEPRRQQPQVKLADVAAPVMTMRDAVR